MTRIERLERGETKKYLLSLGLSGNEYGAIDYCSIMSVAVWAGFINDKLACVWGVMPPTLLSTQAYLWLYTTDAIEGHDFVLVRHSQLVMEEILKEFPSVIGHAVVNNPKSIRWLKWLGAKFGEPRGDSVAFRIEKNGC